MEVKKIMAQSSTVPTVQVAGRAANKKTKFIVGKLKSSMEFNLAYKVSIRVRRCCQTQV